MSAVTDKMVRFVILPYDAFLSTESSPLYRISFNVHGVIYVSEDGVYRFFSFWEALKHAF
jgi:hypothetical protein